MLFILGMILITANSIRKQKWGKNFPEQKTDGDINASRSFELYCHSFGLRCRGIEL